MKIFEDIASWQAERRTLTGSVGFVPTMGALHAGHLSLLSHSIERHEHTVLSIYVNPTQFNDPKDLDNYPNTLEADLQAALALGVDHVILPTYDEIYADGFRYQVNEDELSRNLCGENRPGHFTGVLTVVMKLLNLVRPDCAYFGQKDYQQYQLVRDMAHAFFMDVDIVACDTVREANGLALSSRNKLLNAQQRHDAGRFNEALRSASSDTEVAANLAGLGYQVDYVETRENRRFGAIVVDCGTHTVRLIDNVELRAGPNAGHAQWRVEPMETSEVA